MVAAEKDRVFVLAIQRGIDIDRAGLFLRAVIDDVVAHVGAKRLIGRDGVLSGMLAALGGKRPFKGVGQDVDAIVRDRRFDPEQFRRGVKRAVRAEARPMVIGTEENTVLDVVLQGLRHVCVLHKGRERLIDRKQILLLVVRGSVLWQVVAHDGGSVRHDHRSHAEVVVLNGEILHCGQRPAKNCLIGCFRDLDQIIVLTEIDAVGLLLAKQLVDPQLRGDPAVARKELIGKGGLQL